MSLINISNLTFCYNNSELPVFENVNININTDWKTGLVGRNGKGKTTLLKILAGELNYSGSIAAQVKFTYFPFEVNGDDTAADIVKGLINDLELWRLQRELNLLDVEESALYIPYKNLSGGEKTKILLAALFLKENNFLLIDEPANHLDEKGRETVSRYLTGKTGFILVSHDRAFLDNCTDHTLALNKSGIEIIKGNFSVWYNNKQMRDESEKEENENLSKEIERLKKAAERTISWAGKAEAEKYGDGSVDKGYLGHKAAKIMKRAMATQNRKEKAAEEKSKLLKDIDYASEIKITPLYHYSSRLVEVKDLTVLYGGKAVRENISFPVNRGERVSLRGKNGSGKSSIIKLLCGENIGHKGIIEKAAGLIISYVPQDTSGISGTLKEIAQRENIDITQYFTLLRKLDFSRDMLEKDIKYYSEGQKKKALLAASLCKSAHLYIWDEPLNYIDILSRIQIEEAIKKYQPSMLFVEHDISFNNTVATRQILI